MPRVLVDGYNLLLRLGRGAGADDRDRLVREAARYRQDRAVEVVVVFDSRQGGGTGTVPLPGVRTEYARGEADTHILELVRCSNSPRDLLVVTSDRRLAAAARDLGARTESAEDFVARAERRRSRGGRPGPPASDKPGQPGAKEVDEWLRRFGEPRDDEF